MYIIEGNRLQNHGNRNHGDRADKSRLSTVGERGGICPRDSSLPVKDKGGEKRENAQKTKATHKDTNDTER